MPTAVILPFQSRLDPLPSPDPAARTLRANRVCRRTADADPVPDLLIALETRPLSEPCILADRTLDRLARVHVVLPDFEAALHPHQARLAADALDAEQAFPGCSGVAARLRDVADQVDRAGRLRPITDAPAGSGALTVLTLAAGALALAVLNAVWG